MKKKLSEISVLLDRKFLFFDKEISVLLDRKFLFFDKKIGHREHRVHREKGTISEFSEFSVAKLLLVAAWPRYVLCGKNLVESLLSTLFEQCLSDYRVSYK